MVSDGPYQSCGIGVESDVLGHDISPGFMASLTVQLGVQARKHKSPNYTDIAMLGAPGLEPQSKRNVASNERNSFVLSSMSEFFIVENKTYNVQNKCPIMKLEGTSIASLENFNNVIEFFIHEGALHCRISK